MPRFFLKLLTCGPATYRVRHEAGEALGAIGTPACLKELQQYLRDPCLEVSFPFIVLSVSP